MLVLGASGMLGHALMYEFLEIPRYEVFGTIRGWAALPPQVATVFDGHLEVVADVLDSAQRAALFDGIAPEVVINAVGVVKQSPSIADRAETVQLNALLPHLIAADCTSRGIRLIHVSTDCVFSGSVGNYAEDSVPDPTDFYGRSKLLGEVGEPQVTLRTSIVGHELGRHTSLIDWFLRQKGSIRGFTRALYSGVTTVELAQVLANVIIPRPDLTGLFHVASEAISKYELLNLVADVYGWPGEIQEDAKFECDRTMTANRLRLATGYRPPAWAEMINEMKVAHERWASLTNPAVDV